MGRNKEGVYGLAILKNKDETVTVMIDNPKVSGSRTIYIVSATSRMSIDLRKVSDVSSSVEPGKRNPNWKIALNNGYVIYLGSDH